MTSPQSCDFQLDFSDEREVSRWRTVLDGVMGGRSSGNRYHDTDHMVFQGVINTNGGGFSSIRRQMEPGDMAGAESLTLRLRPDDRTYKLTFRTSERFRFRSVSYQLTLPKTQPGEWAEITVPLKDFDTSVFGRRVPAAPFDASDVREMGFIIADGIDGPFKFRSQSLRVIARPRLSGQNLIKVAIL